MGQRYKANQYDILMNNCNHFTEDFLRQITDGMFGIPNYLNRAASIGSVFHCIVPNKYLTVTAPAREELASNALIDTASSA